MTAKLFRRIWLVITAATMLCTALLATPIKPDIRKIIREQERRTPQYDAARAGWHGPETVPASQVAPNPVLETYGPAATVRAIRRSLVAAAIPDPRAVAAIAIAILLLRFAFAFRQAQMRPATVSSLEPEVAETPKAA